MHPRGRAPKSPGLAIDIDGVEAHELARVVADVGQRDGWDAAVAVIRACWDQYASTQPQHLLTAIATLPGRVLLSNPGLVAVASYLRQIAVGTSPHRFEHDPRFSLLHSTGTGSLVDDLILLTATAANYRTEGDVQAGRDAAQQGRRLFDRAVREQAPSAATEEIQRSLPHLFVQWGRSLEASETAGAAYEYEEAHHFALVTDQPQVGRRAAGHLAWHYAERGRINLAANWVERARASGEPDPRYEAVIHLAAALVLLEQGARIDAGVELARARAYPAGEYWTNALWLRSLHAVSAPELTQIDTELVSEVERHGSSRLGPVDVRYLRAARLTIGASPVPRALPAPSTMSDQLLDATEALGRGEFEEARNLAWGPSKDPTVPRIRSTALMVCAVASVALKQPGAAEDYFRNAHAILEQEGMSTPYRLAPPEILRDLASVSGHQIPSQLSAGPAVISVALGSLTKREREVLQLLTTSSSFETIADELFVSVNTVKTIARRLYRKLNVRSRGEAAEIALRAGISLK